METVSISMKSFIFAHCFLLLLSAVKVETAILPRSDIALLEFPLNLEYLEAEFFLWGALGKGLDVIAPELVNGGPSPIGTKKASLDPFTRDIIAQFAFQEVGHVRAIKKTVRGFPRPLLNLSRETFATVMNNAMDKTLFPPFDPYVNSINYLLASYCIPYVGLTGYVGSNPKLQSYTAKKLAGGLLGIEAGQDAVIRTLLLERALMKVEPYGITVAEFTDKISEFRDKLGKGGVKDEGLVEAEHGGDGRWNVLASDHDSLSFGRTPEEILRILYGNGQDNKPGGFYPNGGDGWIAKSYLIKERV